MAIFDPNAETRRTSEETKVGREEVLSDLLRVGDGRKLIGWMFEDALAQHGESLPALRTEFQSRGLDVGWFYEEDGYTYTQHAREGVHLRSERVAFLVVDSKRVETLIRENKGVIREAGWETDAKNFVWRVLHEPVNDESPLALLVHRMYDDQKRLAQARKIQGIEE